MSESAFATATFSNHSISSGYTGPQATTVAGGSLWYLEVGPGASSVYDIGNMTTSGVTTDYNIRTLSGSSNLVINSITTGSDGNVWFDAYASGGALAGVLNISTGSVTMYASGVYIYGTGNLSKIVAGSDGNLYYYTQGGPANTQLLYVNPTTGVTTVGRTFDSYADITNLTSGPDGKLWLTDDYYGRIEQTSVTGSSSVSGTTFYRLPSGSYPVSLASGPDGNLWFMDNGTGKITKFSTTGAATQYTPPTGANPSNFIAGSDGNVWFIDGGSTPKIDSITTSGTITQYAVSYPISGLVLGPDGAFWYTYTDSTGPKLGSMIVSVPQSVAFTSTAPAGATLDSPAYAPTASATSSLPVAITVDSSSSSVCSIDGSGNVTYQAAGTCTLDANQAGNAYYDPAPQVQQSFTVLPVNADTSVALSCPSTALVGTSVSCTITVTNNGPAAAQNATLNALFTSSLTGVSVSGGTLSGQTITWSTPSLASGDSATVTITGTASTAGKVRFNAALLQTSPDPNISNNIAASTVTVS